MEFHDAFGAAVLVEWERNGSHSIWEFCSMMIMGGEL